MPKANKAIFLFLLGFAFSLFAGIDLRLKHDFICIKSILNEKNHIALALLRSYDDDDEYDDDPEDPDPYDEPTDV